MLQVHGGSDRKSTLREDATCLGSRDTVVKYLDSNKSWVTLEVVSLNHGRIRVEMSRVATTRLRGR